MPYVRVRSSSSFTCLRSNENKALLFRSENNLYKHRIQFLDWIYISKKNNLHHYKSHEPTLVARQTSTR